MACINPDEWCALCPFKDKCYPKKDGEENGGDTNKNQS